MVPANKFSGNASSKKIHFGKNEIETETKFFFGGTGYGL